MAKKSVKKRNLNISKFADIDSLSLIGLYKSCFLSYEFMYTISSQPNLCIDTNMADLMVSIFMQYCEALKEKDPELYDTFNKTIEEIQKSCNPNLGVEALFREMREKINTYLLKDANSPLDQVS